MIPVILSGGSGTRLWPVSRASYPKQFCEFYDRSFLRETLDRFSSESDPLILTVQSMKALTEQALEERNLSREHAIYEPMGRNTAPAVALLCHILQTQNRSQEVVGIFPADHLIADQDRFREVLSLAEKVAKTGEIVTLGIQPKSPATGYGYIEVTDQVLESQGNDQALRVKGFREKPDEETAKEFLKTGKHFWNAGMFLFQVEHMISLFKKHQPELWARISKIDPDLSNAKYAYANVESISLDYAIMEKVKSQVCIPCDIGWSDVGSWDELARLGEEFPDLKRSGAAQVFNVDSQNNYIFSIRSKVMGLIGLQNKIIVDTPDALLIAEKGRSQDVKSLLGQIQEAGLPAATEHPFETRPWGRYEVLVDRENFKLKTITVNVGHQLSYQRHQKRTENWTVVDGEGEVVLDGETHRLKVGETIRIPQGSKHRMRNTGTIPLVFTETQTGTYFGEDDIERFEDDYGR